LEIGRALRLRNGTDVALLSTGTLLPLAMECADRLAASGVSAGVHSFHTLKPLDEPCLLDVFRNSRVVVTLEEHSLLGGFGSAVADWLADHPAPAVRLLRLGTRDEFLHLTCEQESAREHFGLTPEAMTAAIQRVL
jgi:transketolase